MRGTYQKTPERSISAAKCQCKADVAGGNLGAGHNHKFSHHHKWHISAPLSQRGPRYHWLFTVRQRAVNYFGCIAAVISSTLLGKLFL